MPCALPMLQRGITPDKSCRFPNRCTIGSVDAWDNLPSLVPSCHTAGRPTRRYFCPIHCRASRILIASRYHHTLSKGLLRVLRSSCTLLIHYTLRNTR
jgi:hypothetical protein